MPKTMVMIALKRSTCLISAGKRIPASVVRRSVQPASALTMTLSVHNRDTMIHTSYLSNAAPASGATLAATRPAIQQVALLAPEGMAGAITCRWSASPVGLSSRSTGWHSALRRGGFLVRSCLPGSINGEGSDARGRETRFVPLRSDGRRGSRLSSRPARSVIPPFSATRSRRVTVAGQQCGSAAGGLDG